MRISNKLPTRIHRRIDTRKVTKIGRNQDCPCGSGLKYKRCCDSAGTGFFARWRRQWARAKKRLTQR
ncbi:MAG: SEC-C metal-binding domain-containing protein [Acidobacteria bacterium]|nr:SEC-C metal-binding domain-containing protein [Acidobacteriota bacterium]